MCRRKSIAVIIACLVVVETTASKSSSLATEPSQVFEIWQSVEAPGETRVRGEEGLVTGRRRPFYQLTNISVPNVSVFLPPAEKRTGAAVLVCPGGGLARLAFEHEGLEIADWLTPQGIAVFVLKYRVPAPSQTGLMDAARAMRLALESGAVAGEAIDYVNAHGSSTPLNDPTESLAIRVTAPDDTEASTVSHLRVGALNVPAAKSAWSTARQRLSAPVAHVGEASTRESMRTAPSTRTSLTWSGVPAGQGSSRSTGTRARGYDWRVE